MAPTERFDAAYYRRFYRDPRTRVTTPAQVQRLAAFVAAYLRHLRWPVGSILDLGCGLGWWRSAARRCWPKSSYQGVEISDHLCRTHGWTHGSAADFAPGRRFDLVVCQGVLQYLPDRAAARALANLGRLCRGALYLEALTTADWRRNCDRSVTDGAVHLRPAAWYRRRLQVAFRNCGGGLFVHRQAAVATYELETLA
ncbi:MAG TPA: class I SAM-dependent methyltransferase [Planctomycetota bacterium]|nr:class I SAM-dependent methyltransferase [Planctomycetota bacterium]